MPRQHSAETRARMSASVKRSWADPDVRAARIDGQLRYNASRFPTQVLVRQSGREAVLAVTAWDGSVPVVDLADQPGDVFS